MVSESELTQLAEPCVARVVRVGGHRLVLLGVAPHSVACARAVARVIHREGPSRVFIMGQRPEPELPRPRGIEEYDFASATALCVWSRNAFFAGPEGRLRRDLAEDAAQRVGLATGARISCLDLDLFGATALRSLSLLKLWGTWQQATQPPLDHDFIEADPGRSLEASVRAWSTAPPGTRAPFEQMLERSAERLRAALDGDAIAVAPALLVALWPEQVQARRASPRWLYPPLALAGLAMLPLLNERPEATVEIGRLLLALSYLYAFVAAAAVRPRWPTAVIGVLAAPLFVVFGGPLHRWLGRVEARRRPAPAQPLRKLRDDARSMDGWYANPALRAFMVGASMEVAYRGAWASVLALATVIALAALF